jgi:hypothetical protein
MSRYTLSIEDDVRVFIGWDNPLQTFFFQKYLDYDGENEVIEIEAGLHYEELPNLNAIKEFASKNGYPLNDAWATVLLRDYNQRTGLTPLQERMRKVFGE